MQSQNTASASTSSAAPRLESAASGNALGGSGNSATASTGVGAGYPGNQSITLTVLPQASNNGMLASLGTAPSACMTYSAPLYDATNPMGMDVDPMVQHGARYTSMQQPGSGFMPQGGSTGGDVPAWMRPLSSQGSGGAPAPIQHHHTAWPGHGSGFGPPQPQHMNHMRFNSQPLHHPMAGMAPAAPPAAPAAPQQPQQLNMALHGPFTGGPVSQPLAAMGAAGAGAVKREWDDLRVHSAGPLGWHPHPAAMAGNATNLPSVQPKATPFEEMLDVLMASSAENGWQQAGTPAGPVHAQHGQAGMVGPGGVHPQPPTAPGHTTVTTGMVGGGAPAAAPNTAAFASHELFGGVQTGADAEQGAGAHPAPGATQGGPHTVAAFEAYGPVVTLPSSNFFQLSQADNEEQELIDLLGLPQPRGQPYASAPVFGATHHVPGHHAGLQAPQVQTQGMPAVAAPSHGWGAGPTSQPPPQAAQAHMGHHMQHYSALASAPLYPPAPQAMQQQQQAMYQQFHMQQQQHQQQQHQQHQQQQGQASPTGLDVGAAATGHAVAGFSMQQPQHASAAAMDLHGIWDP